MTCIRASTAADGERVMEIWRDAVDATHHFLTPEDRAAIEQEVARLIPSAPLWLAVDRNDRAIGFMLLDGMHIEALFVDPVHHGTGVGRSLVAHAVALNPVVTTDVNEQNLQASGFYRRMGFTPTGRSDTDGQGRPYPLVHLQLIPA